MRLGIQIARIQPGHPQQNGRRERMLYGVLDYSVWQRKREIAVRVVRAPETADLVRHITVRAFSVVMAGAIGAVGLSLASRRYVEALLYGVAPTDGVMLAVPLLAVIAMALVAALVPVIRASRNDPVTVLRAE